MAKKKATKKKATKKKAKRKTRKKTLPRSEVIKLSLPLAEKRALKVHTAFQDDGAYLLTRATSKVTKAAQAAFMRALPGRLDGEILQGERGLFRFRVGAGRTNFKRFTKVPKDRVYPSVDALLELAEELNKRFLKRGLRTTVVIEIMQGGAYTPVEVDVLNPIIDG